MKDFKIAMYSEEIDYDLTHFDCGEPYMNTFLTEHLKRQHKNQILRGYMLLTKEEKPRVMGYYTLSGSSFEKRTLPSRQRQIAVPYENAPSVTLGRLAIDKSIQRQGYGELLVVHAMRIVYQASHAVGIYGLFVEALNDKAKQFYLGLGFIQLTGDNADSFFYPIKSIEALFDM